MPNVVDKYPLSPIQQGILFHCLYSPESGVYMVQTHCVLKPAPDVSAFERTWNEVVKRHDIFRTAFEWEKLDDAVQVVYDHAEITLTQLDWRGQSTTEQRAQLQDYLMTERMRGFDFSAPPLMRLALIKLDDESSQFIWTIHHLLIDTWSETLLFEEASSLYRAFWHGDPVNGNPAPSYRDYIKWIEQQDLSEADAFWRRMLQGFQAPTPLGARRTRSQTGETFASQQITLPSEMTTALQTLARQQQVTLNTITQGAWALLLSHYSGESDVVFGLTVSGRPFSLAGAEYIIGPFLNTLPMRVQLPPDVTLPAWLRDVQMRSTDLLQFEYSPLVRVQGLSEVQGGLPLFESIYVFQSAPVNLLETDTQPSDSTLSIHDLQTVQNTNYPLCLVVTPGRQLSLQIVYESSTFTSTTTARMLEHLRNLLAGMIAQPTARPFDLPLLSMQERRELLHDWNQTDRSYPRGNAGELFSEHAERRPEALAVADDEQQWTYGELERRSNQLAHHLRSLGVGPEVRVGVLLERSCNFVLAILAVIKAGGAYVPIDPKYPRDRIRFMLDDVGASVLLTETRLAEQLTATKARVVLLDRESEQVALAPSTQLPVVVTGDHLAYIIYTSGSTGKPKGVAVPHGGLTNLVRWHQESYSVSAEDRSSQVASLSFDGSLWELWPCLTAGASLHVAPASAIAAPPLLMSWLAQREITICFLPTPLMEAVLAEPWPENSRLRLLVAGGDRLHVGAGEAPGVLVNVYGPTENSVVSTTYAVEREEDEAPPIGRPVPNTKVYVLDQRLQPVPVGVTGELYLSGAQLARGYWQRPALTAERFVPHPFSEHGGERMYRTGDLGRYRADGQLEFIGRVDNQVKLRGYRIELGEIEAVLRRHTQVREAVVELQQTDSARLVAYVVLNGANVDALKHDLREQLPEYMVPSTFVLLPELPLNANGKVDRRALRAIGLQDAGPSEGFVAPRTPTEMILAAIWAAVLHCENAGASDNFFELGGHSLLAMRLVSKLRETFKVELPLRDMLEAATLAEMARAIDAALQGAPIEVASIRRRSPEREAPLSFAQQRLWLIQHLEPESTAYNVYNAIRIRGPLNVVALEKALNEIVRRHEILRTTFKTSGDQLVQIVAPPAALRFALEDLRSLPASEQEAEAQRVAIQEAQTAFNLTSGPLFRVRLLRLDDEHVLITCRHHIVFDVWSFEVFTNELIALYEAFDNDQPSPLSELPVQYADFACWERDWLQGDKMNALLRYWKQQLEGVPPVLNLPVDRPASAASSYEGKWQSFTLDKEQTKNIRALSQAERVTVYMVLVAAFKTFLYRYSGQSDFLIGTPVTSRTQPETDSLIGCFMNMLVLRTDLSGNPTFRELLGRVRETVLGAYTHQEMPFERLVEELKVGRAQTSTPLVQVLFSHVKPLQAKKKTIDGLELSPIEVEEECAKADWMMLMVELGDEIVSSLQYRVELFDDETIRRAMRHFENLFHSILKNPDARLDELEMLSQQEQIVLNQEIDVRTLSRSFSF